MGFSLSGAPPRSRVYPADEFVADVEAAGLAVESRWATFDLRPFDPDGDLRAMRSVWVSAEPYAYARRLAIVNLSG